MRVHVLCSFAIVALMGCGDDDGATRADAGADSGLDARPDAGITETWFATKTTLDVWWKGTPTHDPGRADLEVFTLAHVLGACDDAAGETSIKICGITFPPYTSDVQCEAFQLEIPQSAWDSTRMPTFTARAIDGLDAGGAATKAATALIGIDLNEAASWPTSMMTTSVACDDGTGSACFPDHDNDTFAGITTNFRSDRATYVGPYDDGRCTNGWTYRYGAPVVSIGINIGGGPGPDPRINRMRIALRSRIGAPSSSSSGCDDGPTATEATVFDTRTVGCSVDPATLPPAYPPDIPGDPRLVSMDYTCTTAEAAFVDDNMVQYRALASGDIPGDSLPPLGWSFQGRNRDIDKRVSTGTRTASVRLIDNIGSGAEPTCAQVRAAVFE